MYFIVIRINPLTPALRVVNYFVSKKQPTKKDFQEQTCRFFDLHLNHQITTIISL